MCRTPFSKRSTANLQALAWRPSGPGHRTCQRADDLGREDIAGFRGLLYTLAKLMGDYNAVKKGKVGQRVGRRAAGKATRKAMRKPFK